MEFQLAIVEVLRAVVADTEVKPLVVATSVRVNTHEAIVLPGIHVQN